VIVTRVGLAAPGRIRIVRCVGSVRLTRGPRPPGACLMDAVARQDCPRPVPRPPQLTVPKRRLGACFQVKPSSNPPSPLTSDAMPVAPVGKGSLAVHLPGKEVGSAAVCHPASFPITPAMSPAG